jgi:hypothetical protein
LPPSGACYRGAPSHSSRGTVPPTVPAIFNLILSRGAAVPPRCAPLMLHAPRGPARRNARNFEDATGVLFVAVTSHLCPPKSEKLSEAPNFPIYVPPLKYRIS